MKLLRVLFSLIVIAALLAGCKKPPEATPTPLPTATPVLSTPVMPTPTPPPATPYPALPTATPASATPYPVLPTPLPATPYPTG